MVLVKKFEIISSHFLGANCGAARFLVRYQMGLNEDARFDYRSLAQICSPGTIKNAFVRADCAFSSSASLANGLSLNLKKANLK